MDYYSKSIIDYLIESSILCEKSMNIGDKLHQRLNITNIPIVNKYRKGKFKRTLKRGLKDSEMVNIEIIDLVLLVY